ncbi:aldehyde dehydrogenase family protein [Streptomyces sp. NA02950]|uniref:aldehyde dehydrogenase family protein n=1 Tax=Streptomyces sp. NA02950 TaxID=2742137 RepID=UPI0015924BB4|nr:aldehyde dehydrogenase family protein [Streptomyces sp. NA02950]QKV96977.1 aldehyde dehydrogenase family protein [Streptomyces sp. NA02950]
MREYDAVYLGGQWRPVRDAQVLEVENPATEEVIGKVPLASAAETAVAVSVARRALDGWSGTPIEERLAHLSRLHAALATRHEEMTRTIVAEVGAPVSFARTAQVGAPLALVASYLEVLREFAFTERVGAGMVVKEPLGVVGAITPGNYPLFQAIANGIPALAAGCTVVLKPAETAPLSAFLLAEAADEAGLPPGVFNVVPGLGTTAGEALVTHPDVDVVSLTGSTRTGRRVSELAAGTIKKVITKLGGKSANVLLQDADLKRAVTEGVASAFANSAQTCTAWTRMLVHTSHFDEVVELAAEAADSYTVGDPTCEETSLGPLLCAAQRRRVLGCIAEGLDDGARLVAGGTERPDGLEVGYYVRPTVFADVRPDMLIARQEIFGPVLSILPYTDEEEAIRIANDSVYGLSGAVWSADPERAMAFARRLQVGQVQINGAQTDLLIPFGGRKQSGNGLELGRYGLEKFLQAKAIHA